MIIMLKISKKLPIRNPLKTVGIARPFKYNSTFIDNCSVVFYLRHNFIIRMRTSLKNFACCTQDHILIRDSRHKQNV